MSIEDQNDAEWQGRKAVPSKQGPSTTEGYRVREQVLAMQWWEPNWEWTGLAQPSLRSPREAIAGRELWRVSPELSSLGSHLAVLPTGLLPNVLSLVTLGMKSFTDFHTPALLVSWAQE